MKYAIRFYRGCRILNKADEIIIKYESTEPDLVRYVGSLPQEQRLIVNITNLPIEQEENSLKIFEVAYKEHKNFAILCSFKQHILVDLDLLNIPYFFIEQASTFDEFVGMLNFKVKDIYITNELGFYLDKVSKICKDKDIQVRVRPNMAQSSSVFETESVKKFFIRPEDTEFYEQYVDVFEFTGELTQQPVYYEIYRDGRWLGDLNEIIIGLTQSINDMAILPVFHNRASCEKRCSFGKCDLCSRVVEVSKDIENKGLAIKREKRKYAGDEVSGDEDFAKEISDPATADT